MLVDQARHARTTMGHGLDISIVGRLAVQTPSMREWSAALSRYVCRQFVTRQAMAYSLSAANDTKEPLRS